MPADRANGIRPLYVPRPSPRKQKFALPVEISNPILPRRTRPPSHFGPIPLLRLSCSFSLPMQRLCSAGILPASWVPLRVPHPRFLRVGLGSLFSAPSMLKLLLELFHPDTPLLLHSFTLGLSPTQNSPLPPWSSVPSVVKKALPAPRSKRHATFPGHCSQRKRDQSRASPPRNLSSRPECRRFLPARSGGIPAKSSPLAAITPPPPDRRLVAGRRSPVAKKTARPKPRPPTVS